MSGERDLLDYVSLGLDVATLVATVAGLGFVIFSLWQSVRQQRVETGPYVRVDIGPTDGIPDQQEVEVYYEDHSQILDFSAGGRGAPSLEIAAWFRDYQTSPLGFALGVTATFLVEVVSLDDESSEVHFVDVEIPYLEFSKCSKVRLVSLPSDSESSVMLSSLSFHDLYDKRHSHVYGERGTNAVHGRLLWLNKPGHYEESTPEGRSRGAGVDYNVGARRGYETS
jgi:hypothetical protein